MRRPREAVTEPDVGPYTRSGDPTIGRDHKNMVLYSKSKGTVAHISTPDPAARTRKPPKCLVLKVNGD